MLPDLDALLTADAAAAERFFAGVDPEQLVAAVAATSDADLAALLDREEVRRAAVGGILSRLHEYSLEERRTGLAGVARFDLDHRGEVAERHALAFRDGAMTVRRDVAADAAADVVLRTSVLRFVRLVSGERNAGLDYLAGQLDIEGDAGLALGLGGIFLVPGSKDVAVDPTRLDPVDVARVLGTAPRDHLGRVMRSGFRPVVLGEIFRRMPEFVNQDRARGVSLRVGFRLTGDPTGDVERYVVELADGTATVTRGDAGGPRGSREATVTCEGHDFLLLVTGHLNPVVGVLKGQLKVKGDRGRALKLAAVMDIPQAG